MTEMDEPLHVLISASNEETLNNAVERVERVFTQPDLARRLVEKSVVGLGCAARPSEASGHARGGLRDVRDPFDLRPERVSRR